MKLKYKYRFMILVLEALSLILYRVGKYEYDKDTKNELDDFSYELREALKNEEL